MRLPQPASPTEVFVGRSLALCAHPVAAWRVSSARGRLLVIAGYAAAGYMGVIATLVLMW